MIVTRATFPDVLAALKKEQVIAFDTETTGLRPFHGDLPFSLILATGEMAFYLNFKTYPDLGFDFVLTQDHLAELEAHLFSNPAIVWRSHNIKFDMHMLSRMGITVVGDLRDSKIAARLLKNDHFDYSLSSVAKRYGMEKSRAAEAYVKEHKLWEWQKLPGKKQRSKKIFMGQVPFDVIAPYGVQDGRLHFDVAERQEQDLAREDTKASEAGLLSLRSLYDMENALTRTVFHMEQLGVQLDLSYVNQALTYETRRYEDAMATWLSSTGDRWIDSAKAFEPHLTSNYRTAKGKISFDAAALEAMKAEGSELAGVILEARDAKKRLDFLNGFLYYADSHGVIRSSLDQAGTTTGRFSAREPNLQQLTKEEDGENPFPIRRAIVPRPGFFLALLDYKSNEFRLMLDYAGAYTENRRLIEAILGGADVHQATADLAGIPRRSAKTVNFLTIYGGGDAKLALKLGVKFSEARAIRETVFAAAPEIRIFLRRVARVAEARGFIVNWLGRRWHCDNPKFSYKAPNFICQSGGADIIKVAMVRIDRLLKGRRSRLLLTVHDELVLEVAEEEKAVVEEVKSIMESVYPYKYLPQAVDVAYSYKSLADRIEGFPA